MLRGFVSLRAGLLNISLRTLCKGQQELLYGQTLNALARRKFVGLITKDTQANRCLYRVKRNCCKSSLEMADNKFAADYDKRGQAGCKKCKAKIGKEALRLAKVTTNPFSDDGGDMKQYYHPACMFETFVKARATTKIIDDTDVVQGFDDLQDTDKDLIRKLIDELNEKKNTPKKGNKKATPKKTVQATLTASPTKKMTLGSPKAETPKKNKMKDDEEEASTSGKGGAKHHVTQIGSDPNHKDNSFRVFRRLCAEIAEQSSYLEKTKIVSTFLKNGSGKDGFKGDTYLVLRLLLPGVVKRVYNLNNKQLVKIFSQIFNADLDAMQSDLTQGDVAETIRIFFEESKSVQPAAKSLLNIQEVDALLSELSTYNREDDQQRMLTKIAKKCTANDLKMMMRLVKHDLRINSGAKHILEALDPNAYEAFQASRDLRDVVDRVLLLREEGKDGKPGMSKQLSVRANLMTPVLPMLAEACKSVAMAFKKCPNGMYSEIKYDGERVQVHKKGDKFSYYSRSLKPVQPHKVGHFKEYIPEAFPNGDDLILDSEVLLVDTHTGNPLPFGSLGVHKKSQFKDAKVALFVFDCLHYNGQNLMDKPIKKRRKYLHRVMKEVPHRILLSEVIHITKAAELRNMMARVFNEGLEGLVLKDVMGTYEPGKRHWLKVKKDYLAEGAMADSADLIVLGAYYGTGNKGGMMSIFLMGCYNPHTKQFVTVTKCGSGFDDNTLSQLQKDLTPNMTEIKKDYMKIPNWLSINRGNVVPDFIVKDPKNSVVWEISGAEFSKAEVHTADGISIRFPRCTKMRNDKSWNEATDLPRLKELVKISKERSDFGEILGASSTTDDSKDGTKPQLVFSSDSEGDMDFGKPSTSKITAKVTPLKTIPESSTATPKKSPMKRGASKDTTEDTPSKKTKAQDKPLCKYGEACYQKGRTHRDAFSHDFSRKTENDDADASKNKKLPNVFRGLKFVIEDSVPDKAKLYRYITAYDGDVLPSYEKSSATYIVVAGKNKSEDGNEVTSEQMWDCIKRKNLKPIKEP